jgi:hypothetical protein
MKEASIEVSRKRPASKFSMIKPTTNVVSGETCHKGVQQRNPARRFTTKKKTYYKGCQ